MIYGMGQNNTDDQMTLLYSNMKCGNVINAMNLKAVSLVTSIVGDVNW